MLKEPDHEFNATNLLKREVEYQYLPDAHGGVNCFPTALGITFQSCLILDDEKNPYPIEYWSTKDISMIITDPATVRN